MKSLSHIVKNERGQALPLALVILALVMLLTTPFLNLAGTNLLAVRAYAEVTDTEYASDAGIEYGIWHLMNGQTSVPDSQVNNATVVVTVADEGSQVYLITSVATGADGSSTTTTARVMTSDAVDSAFNYAAVSTDGTVRMDADARIYADDYPALNGSVYAHGNVDLNNNAVIDGDVFATGTIDVAAGARINGSRNGGADPLSGLDDQLSQIDDHIDSLKAETLNHGCTNMTCVPYTYTRSNWRPAPGTYSDPQHAKKHMTISGWGGDTWTFQDTVCAGVDTNRDLNIESGNPTVIFTGPVKVGDDLEIAWDSGWNIRVTFMDEVCVGGDLRIGSNAIVVFKGKVSVGRDIDIAGWSNTVTFEDTLYVERNVDIIEGKSIVLGGTVYAVSRFYLNTDGNAAQITGGQHIISDGNIRLEGWASSLNADVISAADIPFLVSTAGTVRLDDAATATALIYAPEGQATIRGWGSKLYGSVVAQSVRFRDWGPNVIEYPLELRDRTDLYGGSGGGGTTVTILSWR